MSLIIRRTALIVIPKFGTVKVSPKGGRRVAIDAPLSLDITDRKGRPLSQRKRVAKKRDSD